MNLRLAAKAILAAAMAVAPVAAYIHFPPPTLKKLCEMSSTVRVLKVAKHSRDKGVIIFEAAETLKDTRKLPRPLRHAVGKETKASKPLFDWLADGKKAVMFTIEWDDFGCGYVFIDGFCYSVDYNHKGDFWQLIRLDPEMAAVYHGTAEALVKVTKDVLAGKDVKVPTDEKVKALTLKEREKRAKALSEVMAENRKK